jgi:glucose/arabinose dehydrogenase
VTARALLIALAVVAASSPGCGPSDARDTSAPAPRSRLPLWRQPPDKRPGPPLPGPAGRARSFRLLPVARGLRAPLQVVARPGDAGRLYVAEQRGLVRVIEGGRIRPRPYLDLRRTVRSGGELGLLTLAFSAGGGRLYVMYTDRGGDTRVVAYAAGREAAHRAGARVLLALDHPYENHRGGTLLVDRRGRLVLGLGDGGSAFDPQQRAQDRRSMLGKLLRLDAARPQAGWQVVATGLRNPWRMSFDRATGMLWLGDVGQDRVDEVDAVRLPETGRPTPNLGWAAFEGDLPLGRKRLAGNARLVWPVAGYRHRAGLCSITGGFVYRGRAVPALRGRYLYGDFCRGTIWSLDAARAGREPDVRREAARLPGLASFGESLDGELYAVSIRGTVHRVAARASGLD